MAAVPSELLGIEEGVGQIDKQPHCHEAGERIVEDHASYPSKAIAGVNIGNRRCEEDEADRQHGDIHHRAAPLRAKIALLMRLSDSPR